MDEVGQEDYDRFGDQVELDAKEDLLDQFEQNEVHLDPVLDIFSPYVGMTFDTIDEAYKCYNAYARMTGFSIRRQRTNRSMRDNSKILRCTLCCSCQGSYTKVKTPQKRREDKRFECKANFAVKLDKSGNYVLAKFNEEHTHDLVPHSSSHYLLSQRVIESSQGGVIDKMHESGISRSKIYQYFVEEAGGAEHLSFTQADCSNHIQKKREDIRLKGDAVCLLDYFKEKKCQNKHFFYKFLTNEEFEVIGVFFCDAISRRDYGLFGDAICFDTTYKTNGYEMKCAPFVGVNNHGQTVLFGCGLIANETTESFVWLFTTFMEAMKGKMPETIFTDEAMAIANAIKVVFPDSHHSLCLWHIQQNAMKNLAHVYNDKTFSARLSECIYEGETIEEFDQAWNALLKDFKLEDNGWLKNKYEKRESWAQVYAHAHFCAGMTTTQRSESINRYLKMFFNSSIILREFASLYDKAMTSRREKEREENKYARTNAPILWSSWYVEREASRKYTRKMFQNFQDEYKRTLDLRLHEPTVEDGISTYFVEDLGFRKRNRKVKYNPAEESASCTCRKFEFQGILCCHVLRVFRELDFKNLPQRYYVKRWTRNATDEVVFDYFGEAIQSDIDPLATTRYSELSHISQKVVAMGAKSNTLCLLAKLELRQVQEKLNAAAEKEEKEAQKSNAKKAKKSYTKGDVVPDLSEDPPLHDPKRKNPQSQPKKRYKGVLECTKQKRKSSQKKNDGGAESTIAEATSMSGTILTNVVNTSTQSSLPYNQGLACEQQYNQDSTSQTYESHGASRRLYFPE